MRKPIIELEVDKIRKQNTKNKKIFSKHETSKLSAKTFSRRKSQEKRRRKREKPWQLARNLERA